MKTKERPSSVSKDGEDEDTRSDGVLFYINHSGIPLDDFNWYRMWDYAKKINSEESEAIDEIRKHQNPKEVPFPKVPHELNIVDGVCERLGKVQRYLHQLQYNHTGTQFFLIKKNRPLTGLMESAREMLRESLPIKCLEAVIISLFLTNCLSMVDRFPISFTSVFCGVTYRHVVLGVYYNGFYGSLGMSRRAELMDKPLTYRTLADLIKDFVAAYRKFCHKVKSVKIGLTVPHDSHSYESICWRHISLSPSKMPDQEFVREINKASRDIRQQRTVMEHMQSAYNAPPPEKTRIFPSSHGQTPLLNRRNNQKHEKAPKLSSAHAPHRTNKPSTSGEVRSGSGSITERSWGHTQSASEKRSKPVTGSYHVRV